MLAPAIQAPRGRRLFSNTGGAAPWRDIDPAMLGAAETSPDESMLVIHVDQIGQVGAQRLVEAWVMTGAASGDAPTDVTFRGLRMLMHGHRAALFGGAELTEPACAALIGFHDLSRRLRQIEESLAERQSCLRGDVELTHAVGHAQLSRQSHVSDMTRWAMTLRLDHTDLMRDLRRPGERLGLDAPARRMLGELILQGDLQGRAEILQDSVECAQELYETANDRLLDYRYFRTEVVIELLILVVLLGELVLLLTGP